MSGRSQERKGRRNALALLACLALALKMLVPAGFMPGTGSAPIVLCPGQGPMPQMAMAHGGHVPTKAPHQAADHPCAFAGLGVASLVTPLEGSNILPASTGTDMVPASFRAIAPGRGLAAPPPPSHAPPARA